MRIMYAIGWILENGAHPDQVVDLPGRTGKTGSIRITCRHMLRMDGKQIKCASRGSVCVARNAVACSIMSVQNE
jgi:hypothetical protein